MKIFRFIHLLLVATLMVSMPSIGFAEEEAEILTEAELLDLEDMGEGTDVQGDYDPDSYWDDLDPEYDEPMTLLPIDDNTSVDLESDQALGVALNKKSDNPLFSIFE